MSYEVRLRSSNKRVACEARVKAVRIRFGIMNRMLNRNDKGNCMAEVRDLDEAESMVLDGGVPDEEVLYDLADLFKVFADTTRIRILYALMERELYVNEIAEVVGVSQSGVSHQLRTLKQAKLVRSTRDGKNVRYALDDSHVFTMLAQGITHVTETD